MFQVLLLKISKEKLYCLNINFFLRSAEGFVSMADLGSVLVIIF